MAAQGEQAEQLIHARRHGELLGGDAIDSALHQHLSQPALDRGPVLLELLLGLDLLAEEQVADASGLGGEADAKRVRQTVRRIGREHDRAQPGGGTAARGGGRHRCLAHSSLARVEDRSGSHQRAPRLKRVAMREV